MVRSARQSHPAVNRKVDTRDIVKMQLASRLSSAIKASGLTQASIAKTLQIDQPKVSKLVRLNISEFSALRLLRFMNLFGCDIDISIQRSSNASFGGPGRLSISGETDVGPN